jgi:hypothetical protein
MKGPRRDNCLRGARKQRDVPSAPWVVGVRVLRNVAFAQILLGVLAGGAVAVVLLLLGRKGGKDAIPFGAYLALGGAIALGWSDHVLTCYLSGRF